MADDLPIIVYPFGYRGYSIVQHAVEWMDAETCQIVIRGENSRDGVWKLYDEGNQQEHDLDIPKHVYSYVPVAYDLLEDDTVRSYLESRLKAVIELHIDSVYAPVEHFLPGWYPPIREC